MILSDIISFASSFSVLAPLVAAIWAIRRMQRGMPILLILFAIAALTECTIWYGLLRGIQFEWVHHIYTPVEYGLFATVFAMWDDNLRIKKIILASIPLFAIICLLDAFFGKSMAVMNSLTISISLVLYVLLSSYSLLKLQADELAPILKNHRFWIYSALLLYSSGALVYFALLYYLPADLIISVQYLHSAVNITANLLYSGGFICLPRR
jgi:hypothetical protein